MIAAVERILEEEGYESNEYIISQTDTPYQIGQLTQEVVDKMEHSLSKKDYQRFADYYEYSKYYSCYYLKTYNFTEEEKTFMQECFQNADIIPPRDDKNTIVLSLTGYNLTHTF